MGQGVSKIVALLVGIGLTAGCSSGTSNGGGAPDGAPAGDGSVKNDDGGAPDAGTDGTISPDSGPPNHDGGLDAFVDAGYPAPHPAFPQLVDNGGPVLLTPKIVTITFAVPAEVSDAGDARDSGSSDAGDAGDPFAAELAAFGAQATNNPYWDMVRAGYCETGSATACVGDGPVGTSVAVPTAPAASYTDSSEGGPSTFQTFIQNLITAGTISKPDAQTLPIFYLPSTTKVTLNGLTSCEGFFSYHNEMTSGGVTFAYAVVPECPLVAGQKPSTPLETLTFNASDEIAQASTDPFATMTTLGFYLNFDDPAILPWNDVFGGEVGDMCSDFLGLGENEAVEDGFTVQRIWSNLAAAAGGDPCVPAQTAPYFDAAPEQWLVTVPAVGQTVTFDADAFSNMPMSAGWTLAGMDYQGILDGTPNEYMTVTINGGATAAVNNGDRATVSVTLNKDPGQLASTQGGALAVLVSYTGTTYATATAGHMWPFLVQSQADAIDAGFATVDAAQDLPQVTRPHTGLDRAPMARFARALRQLAR